MFAGSIAVYSALFGIGAWITGRPGLGLLLTIVSIAGALFVVRVWGSVSGSVAEAPVEKVTA
jgi:hypothetical protein